MKHAAQFLTPTCLTILQKIHPTKQLPCGVEGWHGSSCKHASSHSEFKEMLPTKMPFMIFLLDVDFPSVNVNMEFYKLRYYYQ
jgi:hypothetical protein